MPVPFDAEIAKKNGKKICLSIIFHSATSKLLIWSLRFERKGDRKYGLLIHFRIHFY